MDGRRLTERLVIVAAVAYVLGLGWAMVYTTYDVWGAFVIMPIIVIITVPLLKRVFADDRILFRVALAGLFAKFAGALIRYYVAFDAYGGLSDAGHYHEFGQVLARDVRGGDASFLDLVPTEIGTRFMEKLTALVYTVFGSSKLAGFVLFGWMGYWGALWFLLAAIVGVQRVSARRYALLMFFAPSLVYWPSSVGKEAFVCMCLGLASYGGARLLVGRPSVGAVAATALGITGAGFVRPHFAAIWAGALVVALVVGVITGRTGSRAKSRFVTLLFAGIAVAGLVFVASVTLRYLDPSGESDDTASTSIVSTDRISSIFDETERRTELGGSSFEVIDVSGPQDWPYAIVRTLTRPMLLEARNVAQLLPAVEMSVLLVLAAVGWRRIINIPRMALRSPYVLFALLVLCTFGLAFTSIGNLGILTRQRSLIMPLLMLLVCVPPRQRRGDRAPSPVESASTPLRTLSRSERVGAAA